MAMGGRGEKMTIGKPQREASGETSSADTWILDFKPLGLWGNIFLLFKSMGFFCYNSPSLAQEELWGDSMNLVEREIPAPKERVE